MLESISDSLIIAEESARKRSRATPRRTIPLSAKLTRFGPRKSLDFKLEDPTSPEWAEFLVLDRKSFESEALNIERIRRFTYDPQPPLGITRGLSLSPLAVRNQPFTSPRTAATVVCVSPSVDEECGFHLATGLQLSSPSAYRSEREIPSHQRLDMMSLDDYGDDLESEVRDLMRIKNKQKKPFTAGPQELKNNILQSSSKSLESDQNYDEDIEMISGLPSVVTKIKKGNALALMKQKRSNRRAEASTMQASPSEGTGEEEVENEAPDLRSTLSWSKSPPQCNKQGVESSNRESSLGAQDPGQDHLAAHRHRDDCMADFFDDHEPRTSSASTSDSKSPQFIVDLTDDLDEQDPYGVAEIDLTIVKDEFTDKINPEVEASQMYELPEDFWAEENFMDYDDGDGLQNWEFDDMEDGNAQTGGSTAIKTSGTEMASHEPVHPFKKISDLDEDIQDFFVNHWRRAEMGGGSSEPQQQRSSGTAKSSSDRRFTTGSGKKWSSGGRGRGGWRPRGRGRGRGRGK